MSRRSRPLPAAAAGAICMASSATLVRVAEVSPATAAVFRCEYAVPPLIALALLDRRRYGPTARREHAWAALAGLFSAGDLLPWHYAIADVDAGIATVLANPQVVFVSLGAWALLGSGPGGGCCSRSRWSSPAWC